MSDLANDANCAGNRLDKLTRTVETEKSLPTEGDWEWGGCGDNVKFGFKKSRDFMDAPYRKRSDIKTLVKLHNNNAGRLVGGYLYRGCFIRRSPRFHFAPCYFVCMCRQSGTI